MAKKFSTVLSVGETELKVHHKEFQLVDLIEVRLDLCSNHFLEIKFDEILKKIKNPIIFTNRNEQDSNQKRILNEEKINLIQLLKRYESKNNFIDIELNHPKPSLQPLDNSKFRKIYSYHDFKNSISKKNMENFIKTKSAPKNVIFKFAITPKNLEEQIAFLISIKELSRKVQIAGISMGDLGLANRLFPEKFGSKLTYCSTGDSKAPGQLSIKKFLELRN